MLLMCTGKNILCSENSITGYAFTDNMKPMNVVAAYIGFMLTVNLSCLFMQNLLATYLSVE